MPDLLVPRSLATEAINAALKRQADGHMELARTWTAELRRIDPALEVAWVPEQATEFDHPARWHLRKRIPGSIDEWWPLIGPNGEYREPGPWLLDALNANDLWNPRVHRSRKEAREKHREAKLRARKLEAEQRQYAMAEAHRAANRIRDDRGMTHRSDRKRAGEGIRKPQR